MAEDPRPPDPETGRARPESFRARTLSVSLTVTDLERSRAWYRDVVGFTVHEEEERDGMPTSVTLKAGSIRIVITQDDGSGGPTSGAAEGVALHFTTAQELDRMAERIRERGGTLEEAPAALPGGVRGFVVRDPDGVGLSISSVA